MLEKKTTKKSSHAHTHFERYIFRILWRKTKNEIWPKAFSVFFFFFHCYFTPLICCSNIFISFVFYISFLFMASFFLYYYHHILLLISVTIRTALHTYDKKNRNLYEKTTHTRRERDHWNSKRKRRQYYMEHHISFGNNII